MALEGVEKERDYYFSKLREVELLCQEQGEENALFVDRLMEVLYASDEQVSLRRQVNPLMPIIANSHQLESNNINNEFV